MKNLTMVSCNPENLESGDPHIWVSPEIGLEMTQKDTSRAHRALAGTP